MTQFPETAYTVSGNSISFVQTPLTQDLIDIRYISYTTAISYLTNESGNASVSVTQQGNILLTTNGNLLSTLSGNNIAVNGNISATGNITGGQINSGQWTIAPYGNKIYFAFNGSNVGSLDSNGNLIVTGNITPFGTP